jgi:adhesin transport system outer membrane protein
MFTYIKLLLVVLLVFSFPAWAEEDYLLENTMDSVEFEAFKERVGIAVANHPEFRSSQASLRAAYAQIKGSKASLLPQISLILDSNNAISRKYANDSSNLVERSQSDHKTNVRFSINQLLYDFGATRYEVSRSESLAKASRAELSQTILELLYFSIRSYIDVASYATYEKVVEESYLRHQSIKKGIEQRVKSGMAAGRELSRAEAREAEAFAKLVSVKQNLGVSISKFRIYFPEGDLPTKLPSYPYDISQINLATSKLIMLQKNPNILQANQEFSASSFKTKSANASSKPRLDLEIRKNHYNVTKESDEFDTFSAVNFSYDLYTGGRDEAFREQSQAEEDAALNNRDALLQRLVAELKQSVRNLKLLPDRLEAYKNAYTANKRSQYFAQEEFRSSNAVLLDLLQTERDYLDASESLIETLRSSEIEKYSYLQLTGELGETFEIIIN